MKFERDDIVYYSPPRGRGALGRVKYAFNDWEIGKVYTIVFFNDYLPEKRDVPEEYLSRYKPPQRRKKYKRRY